MLTQEEIKQLKNTQILEKIKSIRWEDGKVSQNFNPLTMMKDSCEREKNLNLLEEELLYRLNWAGRLISKLETECYRCRTDGKDVYAPLPYKKIKIYIKAYETTENNGEIVFKSDLLCAAEDDVLEELGEDDITVDEDEEYTQDIKDQINSRYNQLLKEYDVTETELEQFEEMFDYNDTKEDIGDKLVSYLKDNI